ncbi:Arm DNA-binding domain-containing protein [Microbacterium sp. LWS13-1.2]|uniref:Arm DNA-binding domain-containing protein n=1 Tax=Microbacterium sp. LWS13-1.2 TaxID=3135264 RepID=A0AAU6SED6_9MICO
MLGKGIETVAVNWEAGGDRWRVVDVDSPPDRALLDRPTSYCLTLWAFHTNKVRYAYGKRRVPRVQVWSSVPRALPAPRQTDKRGFRTKREAENFLASVETPKLRGEWVDPSRSRVRFSEIAEAWYASKIRVKPTRSGYRNSLDKHVLPEWVDVRIVDIDHAQVQSGVARLSTTHSASSTRNVFLVVSGALASHKRAPLPCGIC